MEVAQYCQILSWVGPTMQGALQPGVTEWNWEILREWCVHVCDCVCSPVYADGGQKLIFLLFVWLVLVGWFWFCLFCQTEALCSPGCPTAHLPRPLRARIKGMYHHTRPLYFIYGKVYMPMCEHVHVCICVHMHVSVCLVHVDTHKVRKLQIPWNSIGG